MIEMVYHLQLNEALGPELKFMGATLNVRRLRQLVRRGASCSSSASALFELTRRQFARQWGATQEEIEREIKRREAAI